MSKIEETTSGEVRIGPASLYTTLRKLTEAELIRLTSEEDGKKVYHITESGFSALQIEIEKRERYAKYGKRVMEEAMEGKLWN